MIDIIKGWFRSNSQDISRPNTQHINKPSSTFKKEVEPVWFPIIPHKSFEKLSDTSYKFFVDIPVSNHVSKYFPSQFDWVVINKEYTCQLKSIISEEQYKNWKYVLLNNQYFTPFYDIYRTHSNFSVSKDEENYYLDVTIITENYTNIVTAFNSFIIQVFCSLNETEKRVNAHHRKNEISEKWDSINDCFLDLIDISDHVDSSKENNSYTFHLDGLDVITQTEDVNIPYGKSYGRTETVKFDSAKFYLTDKMFQSMVFLKEAQDRILDIVPNCIVQIEVNSKYLKVTLS
jgi:hypothetical protein